MKNLYDLMIRPEKVYVTNQFLTDQCVMWDISLLSGVQCPDGIAAPGTYRFRKNGTAVRVSSEHLSAESSESHFSRTSDDRAGEWKPVFWSEWAYTGAARGPARLGGISRAEPIAANSEWLDRLPPGFHIEAHHPRRPMRIVREDIAPQTQGGQPLKTAGIAMPVSLYLGESIAAAILATA
ncbi:hypothetical protein ACWDR0_10475 [Streptomyces sp. NPDC003691]